jgi:hypothetical protein
MQVICLGKLMKLLGLSLCGRGIILIGIVITK